MKNKSTNSNPEAYNEGYKKGYAEGFMAGFQAGRLVSPPEKYPPNYPPKSWEYKGCPVCGIGADGGALGYVCQRIDCPTRITARVTLPLL